VVFLDEEQLGYTVGYAHQRYKNDDDLLVVVVCGKALPREKVAPPKLKETIFMFCALLFVIFYIYLASSGESSE
jgi:hypothetical protein